MTVVKTERLLLRTVTANDASIILELLNEPAVIANVADRGVRTVADAANYIAEKITPSYEKHGFGFYIIELKDSGMPVGMCGLIKRDALDDVDIGYSILERYGRHGYAFEAAQAVLNYARDVIRLPRVVAITSHQNSASQALLIKLGMRHIRNIQIPSFATESMYFAQTDSAGND